jgi:integrase
MWSDFHFKAGTLRVHAKPEYDWNPKTWEARTVPIPDDLAADLEASARPHKLIFPGKEGKPNHKLLRLCKAIAKRAKLDESRFFLHKFRATFATTCLQKKMVLRDLQKLLGHNDIKSTMRYLGPSNNASMRDQVNRVWG